MERMIDEHITLEIVWFMMNSLVSLNMKSNSKLSSVSGEPNNINNDNYETAQGNTEQKRKLTKFDSTEFDYCYFYF